MHEGVNEQNLASIPKSGPEIKNRCTQQGVNGENRASIPKFGPEIKNRCTKEGVNGENLASIPKSEPEIKNRCTQKVVFGEILASILKFGPEIENRCTNQPIFSTHPQHIPPARVHHALTTRLALDVLHGDSDAGSTVAAKAGADAPGGGISLSFCRRGCAAPAKKPPRSTTSRHETSQSRHETATPEQPHTATKKSGRKVSAGLLIQIIKMESSKP